MPTTPSRPLNAQVRKRSSSKAVPSGNTAVKKSRRSSASEPVLTVSTPTSSRLRALAEAGMVVPDEIPTDDDAIPMDFTTLSNRDIGAVHSRYAVRHAHAIFHVALAGTRLVTERRNLRIVQAKFRLQNKGEMKNIVDAMMEEDEDISSGLDKISTMEAQIKLMEAVAQGYADLRDAASREITRRLGERAAVFSE